jgi:hypothetical protein
MKYRRAYTTWRDMLKRCTDPRDRAYKNYGARGISVSDSWCDFAQFLKDMGDRPPEMTLERNNNELPYSKENCRWATRKEQVRNRRVTLRVEYEGVQQSVAALAERFSISPYVVRARLKLGWEVHRALTSPLNLQHSHRKLNLNHE